ncbi:tetratricopeptide repeat protein [Paenibacillus assamensis]|uniref:tetratricopeptide repeat protein n=1 Tax=Paenibacillus assamensis TaxID=311244 RepID=UPI0003FEE72B|nr:tetratricopeptide repeat protein [Paenibacillus assamensis]
MADNKPQSTGTDLVSTAKIVAFPVDGAAYAERGMKALERLRYDKALTYFRKAVQCEPDNPIHQCNLAGVLAESGQFEESNQILEHVVHHVEPEMTDCFYYMANNCAYLEQFEQAEALLRHYLKEDPYGAYAEEAEEMLQMLMNDMHHSNQPVRSKAERLKEKKEQLSESFSSKEVEDDVVEEQEHFNSDDESEISHERARALLEEGKFIEAERMLLEVLEQDPDYLAARNNLALAYYYMGRFDEAVSTLENVLERDSGNLHALCNLVIFEKHAGNDVRVADLVQVLSKTEPFHQEHAFKLATTMGSLGEHSEAYRHLKRLIVKGAVSDASVYHYAAVAACHVNRYDEAGRWWATCRRLDNESGVAAYYIEQLQQVVDGKLDPMPSYHYRIPYEEERRRQEQKLKRHMNTVNFKSSEGLQAVREDDPAALETAAWEQQLKTDPLVRSSLFWALRFGETGTKLQALQAIHLLHDEEAKEALHNLLLDPAQELYLKQVAFYMLRKMGVEGPITFEMQGEELSQSSNHLANHLPEWKEVWQKVLTTTESHMQGRYNVFMLHDIETMWIEFLTQLYPDVPRLQKAEAWSAALEYRVAKLYQCDVTLEQLAERYGTSSATISKHVKRMDEVSEIDTMDITQ